MRKVILGLTTTLDGFIEGPNGEYDWCFTDQDYGMTAFLERIDAMFIGRKSFEVLKASEESNPGETYFPGIHRYIFSTTLSNTIEGCTVVTGDLAAAVEQIRNLPGKDIWLFGGEGLFHTLMKLGHVDELWLSVHPILLGSGKRLFERQIAHTSLTLIDTKTYDTGLVSLRYQVIYADS